jgi:sulfite exporter TauE/SafE
MTDAASTIALSAALIAGISGSAHCFAMCGGLAGALSMRTRSSAAKASAAMREALLHQIGRMSGYASAGALFGWVGGALQSWLDLPRMAAILRLAGGALIVLVAMRLLSGWNLLAWPERIGARLWRKLQPLTRLAANRQGASRSLLLGLLWGWLPCGLVYSMLVFATLSGDALRGAAIMLAFGAGTLPAMWTSSVFASQLTRVLQKHGARRLSGALLLVFGIWLGWAALPSLHQHSHQHVHGLAAAD